MSIDDFAALHTSAEPLVLFNIWDAGSAAAVARAGARAIATGSLSLAGAQGFDDGRLFVGAATHVLQHRNQNVDAVGDGEGHD